MATIKETPYRDIQKLTIPLTSLDGIGPKRAEQLGRKGLHTVIDLLYFTPIRYEDRRKITPIGQAEEGATVLVKGKVLRAKEERFPKSRKSLYRITIQDGRDNLDLLWFKYKKPYLTSFSRPGSDLLVYGTIRTNNLKKQIAHPEVTLTQGNIESATNGYQPVYSSIQGLSNNRLRSLIRSVLDNYRDDLIDPIPPFLREKFKLPDLRKSIEEVHFPPNDLELESLTRADTLSHQRLLFDRIFYVLLNIAYRKSERRNTSITPAVIPYNMIEKFSSFMKFSLTNDQYRTIKEISEDLSKGTPMYRLLMGDVGTGKTLIAAMTAYIMISNNRQAAIMAPTLVLARQHMEFFTSLPSNMGFRPVLLTGDSKGRERTEKYNRINEGRYNLIIGTHSLIQEKLTFSDLGIAIIDEQHRFGVRQRALMNSKGEDPHILVMTATPIPRTLATTLYGDMDISTIDEYPSDRVPVKTHLIKEEHKRWAYEELKKRLAMGQQAFVICPVIEEAGDNCLKSAEEMARRLKNTLSPPFRVGLIHGRLSSEEKEEVMWDLKEKRIDILVGTTIMEVGIHIPDATIMFIEHPERFGLAQLHQLRGRIGRGKVQGACMLIITNGMQRNIESRLNILIKSNNGSEIAMKDLELRGHGEFTGTRQSGSGELDLAEIVRNRDLIIKLRSEIDKLLESDPGLLKSDNRYMKSMMKSLSDRPLDL